jgi:hypothetical protein
LRLAQVARDVSMYFTMHSFGFPTRQRHIIDFALQDKQKNLANTKYAFPQSGDAAINL